LGSVPAFAAACSKDRIAGPSCRSLPMLIFRCSCEDLVAEERRAEVRCAAN
jgi:hypothetical protein